MLDDKTQLILNLKQFIRVAEQTAILFDKLYPELNKGEELKGAAAIAKDWLDEIQKK